jgi:hypothetical protein
MLIVAGCIHAENFLIKTYQPGNTFGYQAYSH